MIKEALFVLFLLKNALHFDDEISSQRDVKLIPLSAREREDFILKPAEKNIETSNLKNKTNKVELRDIEIELRDIEITKTQKKLCNKTKS